MHDPHFDNRLLFGLPLERLCFFLACLLTTTPFLFAHYPPMVDIPQHAAQVETLRALLFQPDYPWRELFQINWTRPYWGGYLPLLLLGSFLPIHVAVKVLAGLIVMAIPLATSRLRSWAGGNPILDWLSLPIAYGFAFQWGFLNFLMGVPVVLLFLVFAFTYADHPTRRRGIMLAFFSIGLFAMHLLIAAFGLGIASLYIVLARRPWKDRLREMLPLFAWLPAGIIWLALKVQAGGQTTEPGPWDLSLWRPLIFLASATGEPVSVQSMAIGLMVFSLPLLAGFTITRNRQRLALFAALALWMLLGPNYIFGNYYTFNRFAIFGIPFYLLLLESPRRQLSARHKGALALLVLVPVFLLLSHALRFATFDLETRGYRDISQSMEPGKRALGLMFRNTSIAYDSYQPLHFHAWYQAEKGGVADFSFAQYSLQVTYRQDADIPIPRGFDWHPEHFDWLRHHGWEYDYFIVRHPDNPGPQLFGQTTCPVQLIANSGDWWLFATDKPRCLPLPHPDR